MLADTSSVMGTSMTRRIAAGLLALATLPASAGIGWDYDERVDPMTSKKTTTASFQSDQSLNLDAPYAGKNFATVFVRQSPRSGLDVILRIDKGQLVCPVSGCRVLVRFDDQEPRYFSATEPADHSPNVLFLEPASGFVASARKAKRIRIQANIYQHGAPVMEFTGVPLTWPWPAKSKP